MAGDEEEDDVDDLENEFNFVGGDQQDPKYMAEVMLQGHGSYGRRDDINTPYVAHVVPQVPLLTNGEMVIELTLCCQYFAPNRTLLL